MRKAIVLLVAIFVLAVATGTGQNVSIEVPSEITGFFVSLSTSIITIFKQVVKQLLLVVANML
jgi:hypothetical protein